MSKESMKDWWKEISVEMPQNPPPLEIECERLRAALKATRNEWECEAVRARVCQEHGREANARQQIAAIDAALVR